jgi:MerR family transcriptional regulator, thiopeptide resistance regulator
MQMKIGELARRTGVSVRTLHHYDQIGLVSPSCRSESGHRLYGDGDILLLQEVISLRSLGLPLERIGEFLRSRSGSPLQVLEMHLEKLQAEARERQKLIDNIGRLAGALRTGQNPTVDELLDLIEATTMFEKYYSAEELETLQERSMLLGEDKIRQVENEWQVLIEAVRGEMARGSDPASPAVQSLARRWQLLLQLFTGGNAAIERSCRDLYEHEGPEMASRGVLDKDVFDYIGKAISSLPDT